MSHRRSRFHRDAEPSTEFFASCPEGFEDLLAQELRSLDMKRVRPLKGRVSFAGEPIDGERACLWSRLASRVYTVITRFDAVDADELYEGARMVDWKAVLVPGASIAVSAQGTTDQLRNSHFTALRVKDAICDRLADATGLRAQVDVERPDARIFVTLSRGRASLHLDLSGDPLFRRLPRAATLSDAVAPVLRPDYAALVLERSGFTAACRAAYRGEDPVPVLIDPNCSGGGIALEAARAALGIAPGLERRHWGFMGWGRHDAAAWSKIVDEARMVQRECSDSMDEPRVLACTGTPGECGYVSRVLHAAGVHEAVSVFGDEPAFIEAAGKTSPDTSRFIATDASDLSIGETARFASLLSHLRSLPAVHSVPAAAIDRDGVASFAIGAKPSNQSRIMPGNEPALLSSWDPQARPIVSSKDPSNEGDTEHAARSMGTVINLGNGKTAAVLLPESEQFANRLKKNARLRRKWAKRTGVTSYRVYDADLPDYSAAIDLYEGSEATPGRWIVIAEYAAPKSIDPVLARSRMLDMIAVAPEVLEVPANHVYAKARTKSKGGSQYARNKAAARDHEKETALIEEGGLTFEVNFNSYLDTGIFLDHRVTRSMVRELAREMHARYFLNLFAYTGTASCYAADAGVEETVTVDLSNTYLDWAERNMQRNGFTARSNHYVRADVLSWMEEMIRRGNTWDLIFCDPPTFSNSSGMNGRTWDVQRDHVELLDNLCKLLMPNGKAIFSCNLRTFKPDLEELESRNVKIEDITKQTIPEDFSRNQKVHHCYIVSRLR